MLRCPGAVAVNWYMCMQMLLTGSQLQKRTLIQLQLEIAYLVFTEGLRFSTRARRARGSVDCILHGTNDKNASAGTPRLFNLLGRRQPISEGCGWETGARHKQNIDYAVLGTPQVSQILWLITTHPDTISCCRHSDYSITVVIVGNLIGHLYTGKHSEHSLNFDSRWSLPPILWIKVLT